MLIKSADDRSQEIAELNGLLTETGLSETQKKKIRTKIRDTGKGAWGEEMAAYYLNFHFASSESHLLLHDFRLVLTDGRTAQIDHLLINRFQDFYVLESKNWGQLTVDETGACTTWAGRIVGVESPLEQCRRHAEVLAAALQNAPQLKILAPRYQIIPRVLIAPSCHLKAPYHEEWYVKADGFYSARAREIENLSLMKSLMDLPRFTGKEAFMKLGGELASLHHPQQFDWRSRFGVSPAPCTSVNELVLSIEGLAEFVPRSGKDWFVLQGKPTEETKRVLRSAGYRANRENSEWVWRLRK